MSIERLRIILETKKTGDGDTKAKKGMEGLVKTAKFLGSAFAAIKSAEVVVEFAKVGAEAKRQQNSLDSLAMAAGTTGDAIVEAMQNASDRTIDRMGAMEAANKALVMDVAKTPEQFERMTKVATALGRAMGQDATKSIDDFMTAAARQSMMIADNLGLTVSVTKAQERYAQKLGKTVGALTDAEKKQAFLNLMLEEGEKKMADLNTELDEMAKIEMLTAAIADAKTGFAELFVEIIGGVGGVQELSRRISGLAETAKQAGILIGAAGAWLGGYLKTGKEFETTAQRMERAQYNFNNTMLRGAGLYEDAVQGTELLQYARLQGLPSYAAEQAALETTNAIREASATGLDRYWDAMGRVHQSVGSSVDSHTQYQAAMEATQAQQDASAVAALAAAEAQEVAAAAAAKSVATQLELAASLKGATDAQIAQAAIQQLGAALSEGKITQEQYNQAVGDVQLAFGLADQASLNLAANITALTTGVGDGTIAAEDYALKLGVVAEQYEADQVQLETFGQILDTSTTKVINQTTELGNLSGGAERAAGQVGELNSAVESLPSSKTITINIVTKGSVPSGAGGDNIPQFQGGTTYAPGGLAWVGEAGAELVHLPRGSQVIPASRARTAAGGAGGGNTYITVTNHIMEPNPERLVREITNHLRLKGQLNSPILGG